MEAFTIGKKSGYDRTLSEPEPVFKWGVHPEEEPPYEGGWVWRTAAEAQLFIQTTDLPFEAAVYALQLPADWDTDVSPEPHPSDGVHRLQHDARILRRVDP